MRRGSAALVVGALASVLTVGAASTAPASARVADGQAAARAPLAAAAEAAADTQDRAACSSDNATPFRPRRAQVGALGSKRVLGVPRLKGLPGTPPLTDQGKIMLGWDRPGIRPGFSQGHVLMNAHAWPDGSALGNAMNAALKPHALIRVYGAGGRVQCYRVVRHVVAKPSVKLERLYYGTDKSPARLAIITCAGVRLGPGHWTKRAVWLAKPIS